MLPWELITTLLTKFIPDPEQREKALQSARDQYIRFLEATSGPLYQVYRFALMMGAAVDFFANNAGRAVQAAKAAGADPVTFVWIEIIIMVWPIFGDKIVEPGVKLLTIGVEQTYARLVAKAANGKKTDTGDFGRIGPETIARTREQLEPKERGE